MIKKILLLVMKPTILVGGQAVIEGVMMRVPGAYATAVRDPKGKVHFVRHKFVSITEKSNFWKVWVHLGRGSGKVLGESLGGCPEAVWGGSDDNPNAGSYVFHRSESVAILAQGAGRKSPAALLPFVTACTVCCHVRGLSFSAFRHELGDFSSYFSKARNGEGRRVGSAYSDSW